MSGITIHKRTTYKAIIFATLIALSIVLLIFLISSQETVAKVAGRKITGLDVNRLTGASEKMDKAEKISLIADSYLYDATLEKIDPTYDEKKVRSYTNDQLGKERPNERNSAYYKQFYLTSEQKKRVERYLGGGFIADYVLMRYDQNFSSKDFKKVSKDLINVENLKEKLQDEVSKGSQNFNDIERRVLAESKETATKIVVSKGKLSSLGAIDDSSEQGLIAKALQNNQIMTYSSNIYSVDIYRKTSQGQFPGMTLIYQVNYTLQAPIRSFEDFINQQKQEYGYEIF